MCLDKTTIFARKTNSLAAGLVDHHDDILLYLAAKHPFDDFHGFRIGNSHALNE